MPLGPAQKAALERRLSGIFDNSPFLKSFPIAKWMVYRSCNLTIAQQYPSLLESLSRLGLYLAAVGFSVSLLTYTIIPTICCGAVMMIFRSTIIELRKQAHLNNQIQRLETVNTRLEASLEQQRTIVTQLQETLSTAHITTERIQQLQVEEQICLRTLQETQAQLQAVTTLLDQRMAHHTAKLTQIQEGLQDQVDRLTTVTS